MDLSPYKLLIKSGQKKALALSAFLSCCEIFPVLGVTWFIQRALNQSVHQGDLIRLIYDGLGVIFCTVAITLLALANTRLAIRINREVSSDLYSKMIDQCLRLNPIFFHQNNASSFNHSIIQDSEKFNSMVIVFLVKFIPASIVAVAITLFLFFLSPWLALILVAGMPVFFLCSHTIEKKVKLRVEHLRESLQSFGRGIRFLFDMMDLIHTHSTEERERINQNRAVHNLGDRTYRYYWIHSIYNLSQNFIAGIVSIIILIIGGASVIRGRMSWEHLIVFYIAVGMLRRYVQTLISAVPSLIEGNLAFQKILSFLNQPEQTPYSGRKEVVFRGNLRFEGVAFSFSGKPLFEKVNFSLQQGEIIALFGANGAGKSTIANLILGFYKPSQGRIYFENDPIEEIHLKTLRSSISIVRQNPLIFPGTIGENLFYGSPHASMGELKEAAQIVGLTEFIEHLPLKYETPTGMSGLYLSGGQKQKIALARALLRKPKLLILDEPTNHLDANAIRAMFEALNEWKKTMSILLISHHKDLSSLADRIYDFSDGILTSRGHSQSGRGSDLYQSADGTCLDRCDRRES